MDNIQDIFKLGVETKYINGKEEIMEFYPGQDFLCKEGYIWEVYKEFTDWRICHIKLLFGQGDRVRIFMVCWM